MAEPKSSPVLEAVMQVLMVTATLILTLPEAEREILKRKLLDKTWTLLNRCARWFAGRSMTIELSTGVENYRLPLLCSRIRDFTGKMYEKSKAKII
jgi:hypothetical protein